MKIIYETIELEVRDYVSPECSCKLEDMVNAIEHVVDSTFDPVNNLLKIKVHRGLMRDLKISPEEYEDVVSRLSSPGKTVAYVATNRRLQGLIAIADLIREESKRSSST